MRRDRRSANLTRSLSPATMRDGRPKKQSRAHGSACIHCAAPIVGARL